MRSLALISLVLVLGKGHAADPPKKAPTAAEDLQQLQGTWEVATWEESGKALAAGDLKKRGVFFGANAFMLRGEDKIIQAGTIQLDPSKSPCTVNLSVREGEGKDGIMLGIYSLEGGELKLCFDPQGQSRPSDFKTDVKSGCSLITLKKPKPAADETVDIVGKYRSEWDDAPTGKLVVMEAVVEKRGDAYAVTYRHDDKVLFVGTAIRKGNQLSMGWGSADRVGVSVYKIETGPRLVGEYTVLGGHGMTGKEVLTPWKETD